jgi:hypothetical protein
VRNCWNCELRSASPASGAIKASALKPIYNWFTEGFDTPVLKEAKALLEQLAR